MIKGEIFLDFMSAAWVLSVLWLAGTMLFLGIREITQGDIIFGSMLLSAFTILFITMSLLLVISSSVDAEL